MIAGANHGGAENFFVRLAIALENIDVEQKVVIRRNFERAEKLSSGGVDFTQLRFGGYFDWVTRKMLGREINHFKPDVLLSWMNRATAFCSKGSLDKFVHVGRIGGYYDLKYYKDCDYLIGNTQNIVDYLKRGGWPSDKVSYLPNFVNIEDCPAVQRQKYFTPEKAPLVLAMGRLHENKGFDILLDALSRVPGAYLWLAGEGPLRKELEGLAERLAVKPRVRFLGWYENISALLRTADIFACPSRHEPFGNVILESWAHGVPVVASDSDGPGALIDHLSSGVLVPVDNAVLLGKAIRNLLADTSLRKKIVKNGFQCYETKFTEDIVTKNYLDFFQRVVSACVASPE